MLSVAVGTVKLKIALSEQERVNITFILLCRRQVSPKEGGSLSSTAHSLLISTRITLVGLETAILKIVKTRRAEDLNF